MLDVLQVPLPPPTVGDIIESYLRKNGYTGLANKYGDSHTPAELFPWGAPIKDFFSDKDQAMPTEIQVPPLTVGDIVEDYLRENNYAGLTDTNRCGCSVAALFPCGDADLLSCRPAYVYKLERGETYEDYLPGECIYYYSEEDIEKFSAMAAARARKKAKHAKLG